METEKMIRELRRTAKKHQNDLVPTFGTNITVMCNDILPKIEKLKQYEDAEKQGLLMNSPCKIGDTVYRLVPKLYRTYTENIVTEIIIKENGITFKTDKGIEWDIDTIGKTIFLTKEEAEQKLSELN